jgi:5-methylcytosine-specific restriction endonuclease McrA
MSIPEAVCARVRQRAGERCGYCRCPQHLVFGWLEIEHVVPVSQGGTSEESNLWLACRFCNTFKSDALDAIDPVSGQRLPLFDPRSQKWDDHFRWSEDGAHIVGLTPTGRATVVQLQLNYPLAVTVRKNWVDAGWHPPAGERAFLPASGG